MISVVSEINIKSATLVRSPSLLRDKGRVMEHRVTKK